MGLWLNVMVKCIFNLLGRSYFFECKLIILLYHFEYHLNILSDTDYVTWEMITELKSYCIWWQVFDIKRWHVLIKFLQFLMHSFIFYFLANAIPETIKGIISISLFLKISLMQKVVEILVFVCLCRCGCGVRCTK